MESDLPQTTNEHLFSIEQINSIGKKIVLSKQKLEGNLRESLEKLKERKEVRVERLKRSFPKEEEN